MIRKEEPLRSGILLAAFTTLLALLLLTSYNEVKSSNRTMSGPDKVISSIPAAIETYSPPTTTPDLRLTPTYAPPPTLEPPPAAQTFPVDKSSSAPNVAWSAQSDDTLTIWVGHYDDDPAPIITDARPVARWRNIRLNLISMVVSPNRQSLAVLFVEPCIPAPPPPTETPDPSGTQQPRAPNTGNECEGDSLEHIYTIDLATNRVQSIPDYYRHYPLYAENIYPYFNKLLGWFDNDRFCVVLKNGQMVTAMKDGSSFIQRTWPGQGVHDTVYESALLPDHETIFAWVSNEFFFRDAPTGAVRKAGNRLEGTSCDYLTPSPNGKLVSYQEREAGKERNDGVHYELWVQELATDARHKLVGSGVWDTQPAWSADSSQIAFAYTESIPTSDDAWSSEFADQADTNIYLADVNALTSHKLTDFQGIHNRDITWTPGGNLLLSSTAGSANGAFGLVAVHTATGTAFRVWAGEAGEELVQPTFFVTADLPGMPRSGVKPDQPTPTIKP
ncbi:MAG TPA: hypothetical protein VJ183_19420 [Chloroflexia bacterium]|nr:hypothetical protein [Chloroflexia bacterium]